MAWVFLLVLVGLCNGGSITVSNTVLSYNKKMTFGANVPAYANSKFMKAKGAELVNAAGVGCLRWPGGSWANQILWDNDYSGCKQFFSKWSHENQPWTFTHQDTAKFAKVHNLEVFWQMNAALGFVCGAEVAAQLSAEFVGNMTNNGYKVDYIEIGNENYGHWEPPYPTYPVNATYYAEICTKSVKAIKAVDSSVQVGCVGLVNEANNLVQDWMPAVIKQAGTLMDFLIIHSYFDKNHDPSVADLLDYGCIENTKPKHDCGAVGIVNTVKSFVAKYAPSRKELPIALTEWNMQQGSGKSVNLLVEGLFVAKYLAGALTTGEAETDKTGGIFANTFFDLVGGKTLGMFNKGATIAYASFYSYAMYKYVAQGGDYLITNSTLTNVTAAGFRHSGGGYGVVVINTDPNPVSVKLEGPWGSVTSVQLYTFGAANGANTAQYESTTYAWNGAGPSGSTGGPYPIDAIKPKTVTLKDNTLAMPGGSLYGVLIGTSAQLMTNE